MSISRHPPSLDKSDSRASPFGTSRIPQLHLSPPITQPIQLIPSELSSIRETQAASQVTASLHSIPQTIQGDENDLLETRSRLRAAPTSTVRNARRSPKARTQQYSWYDPGQISDPGTNAEERSWESAARSATTNWRQHSWPIIDSISTLLVLLRPKLRSSDETIRDANQPITLQVACGSDSNRVRDGRWDLWAYRQGSRLDTGTLLALHGNLQSRTARRTSSDSHLRAKPRFRSSGEEEPYIHAGAINPFITGPGTLNSVFPGTVAPPARDKGYDYYTIDTIPINRWAKYQLCLPSMPGCRGAKMGREGPVSSIRSYSTNPLVGNRLKSLTSAVTAAWAGEPALFAPPISLVTTSRVSSSSSLLTHMPNSREPFISAPRSLGPRDKLSAQADSIYATSSIANVASWICPAIIGF
ncbi:hypothetical protein BKA70DRAFT_1403746 [Coprinopsis sp. MPI-PUGE-AT-0042]|nr:hypothetical protein BKA70DRAFT_1403746 [Coprinopsis sp. MPI-PUGE-AT-0042]